MKFLRRTKRKFFAFILLMFLCVQSIYPGSFCYASGETSYVALGDSITKGTGLSNPTANSYPSVISKSLTVTNSLNLGINGLTSTTFLSYINGTNTSKTATNIKDQIQNAKVITLSIGSNDILSPFVAYVKEAFNCTDLNDLKNIDPSKLKEGFAALQTLLNNDATNPDGIIAGVKTFSTNFPQIVTTIRTLAPDAELYINNLYNPYKQISSIFSFGATAENYIKQINANIFSSSDSAYHLVDVYTLFNNNSSLVNVNIMSYQFDPHPNKAGHQAIADQYLTAMKNSAYIKDIPVADNVVKGNTYTVNKIKYTVTDAKTSGNGTVAVKKIVNSDAATVTIPDKVKIKGHYYKVTKIPAKLFNGMNKLTKITIGKNVISIGNKTFSACPKLTKLIINSKNLTKQTLSASAFSGITKSTVIKVPSSKLKDYKKIFVQKGLKSSVKIVKI